MRLARAMYQKKTHPTGGVATRRAGSSAKGAAAARSVVLR
jgi:hypothetical protein